MPGARDFYRAIAVIALVALLPWLAAWMKGGSLFGFPGGAFVMLLAAPLLLIFMTGGAAHEAEPDPDEPHG